MCPNNFGGATTYCNKEEQVLERWAARLGFRYDIIASHPKGNKPINTDYDLEIVIQETPSLRLINPKVKVEIKIDEIGWYGQTGNIGFDYISAFNFNCESSRDKWIDKKARWVHPRELNDFKSSINIMKQGKLSRTDADLQIFAVYNSRGDKLVLLEGVTSSDFQSLTPILEKRFHMRINDKNEYESRGDTWESAAYYVNPYDVQISKILIPGGGLVDYLNLHEIKKVRKHLSYLQSRIP